MAKYFTPDIMDDSSLLTLIKRLISLEIIKVEEEQLTTPVYSNRTLSFNPSDTLTITITCRRKKLESDRIKELEAQNQEFRHNLSRLHEVLKQAMHPQQQQEDN